jgi:molybdopterin converting factor subunit 1
MNDRSIPTIRVKILFFANLRELAGIKEFSLEIAEGTQVDELKNLLCQEYPNLKHAMESILVAVNKEFAFDEDVIPADAEVAFFPPVSGGH